MLGVLPEKDRVLDVTLKRLVYLAEPEALSGG